MCPIVNVQPCTTIVYMCDVYNIHSVNSKHSHKRRIFEQTELLEKITTSEILEIIRAVLEIMRTFRDNQNFRSVPESV